MSSKISVFEKNILILFFANIWFIARIPARLQRGASADRHETWARDAMDANVLSDVQCVSGRQRRVGLAP